MWCLVEDRFDAPSVASLQEEVRGVRLVTAGKMVTAVSSSSRRSGVDERGGGSGHLGRVPAR